MCPQKVSSPQFDNRSVPVVDIGHLRDGSDPARVAHALHRASHDVEFLPDLKESFIWGYEDEAGHTLEDHALRGANQ